MLIAIVIIAKDEAAAIGGLIEQLRRQSLFTEKHGIGIVVVANGCTDDTTAVAKRTLHETMESAGIGWQVYDTPVAGKARSWNLAVHELIEPETDVGFFLDADIDLAGPDVLADLLIQLEASPSARAVSGYPVKDIARKSNKSLIDRFSLKVSAQTPALHSINGSLYVARMGELRRIWLPVPTPGEDGMLSALIHTDGFSHAPQLDLIERAPAPTHYFETHNIGAFFRHERRMTVGTVINGWLFEHFWAGEHESHVGQLVARRNEDDPVWVQRLIEDHTRGRTWPLPRRMLTWRLDNLRGMGPGRAIVRAPFSLAATVLNLWPAIQANRTLKRKDAAGYW